MKIKKTNYRIVAAAVLFLAATAVPARGGMWQRIFPSGTPGSVRGYDTPGAQGGECSAPEQNPPCSPGYFDQMFVNRYLVWSTAAPVRQNISSWAYLLNWNGSAWVLYGAPYYEGTFLNVAGSQAYAGYFGSPSPEIEHGCPGSWTCTPAFIDLPATGNWYAWTVVVQVAWSDATTGAFLGQTFYLPKQGIWDTDIGCADRAYNESRCWPGRASYGYIYMR